MDVVITPSKLTGTVRIPASKSVVHRLLICAALAEGISVIKNVDFSQDIYATISVLEQFGAMIQVDGTEITVQGIAGKSTVTKAIADCCESGSTLRFLIPIAAALGIETEFRGKGRLPQRPITAYLRELSKKEIAFQYNNTMPFTISGSLQAGKYELEGNVSSQYVTGLLLALPLLKEDSEIHMLSKLESKPYVDITCDCLKKFGVTVSETEYGYFIPGGQKLHACSICAEGDYSQAAFFRTANVLGNYVTLENLSPDSVQGDKKIMELAQQMEEDLRTGNPAGFDVDATDIPDLVPILAVMATFGTKPSKIYGAHRLVIKESDRLTATADLLNTLGGTVKVNSDGLEIYPVTQLKGGTIDSYNDHRIAMCAAIASTRCAEPVTIKNANCIKKSYPEFYHDFEKLGGHIDVINLDA